MPSRYLVVFAMAMLLIAGAGGGVSAQTDEEMAEIISAWKKAGTPGHLAITYPLSGTLFPSEIAPPTFLWKDFAPKTDTWVVIVELEGKDEPFSVLTERQAWEPRWELWDTIKRHSLDKGARVTVLGIRRANPDVILSGSSIIIRTSRDEVGAPIFYRDVPLPFIYAVKNPETIRWRLGDIASDGSPPVVLENLPVCGNCHSFSRDGKTLGMDVDYANDKGSYAITAVEKRTVLARDRIITWSDYRREDEELTFGLLSQVSPDGRYVVSTVKDRSVFVPKDDLAYSQLFFPIKGILAIYDRKTKQFSSLPGADDPRYVQSNPAWSPDGKYLVFSRAPAANIEEAEPLKDVLLSTHLAGDFLAGKRGFCFDVYRISFNESRGGTPEPIPGASDNGMSNFFPRISPDGKWLVFTKAKNFMLLQPDSKLYIMPAEGGTPREMTCNTPNMNSWHSWSPNGKWLVFASKARGAYTQLFLTHVDEDGRDTPPVLLEHLSLPGRAANIPEFVNIRPGEMVCIAEEFLDDYNFMRHADQLAVHHGDFKHAVKYYKGALKVNPDNVRAHVNLGVAYTKVGQIHLAEQEFQTAIKMQPSNRTARSNLTDIYLSTRRFPEAKEQSLAILKRWPDDAYARMLLGMAHAATGNLQEAETQFRETVRLEPHHVKAHVLLGKTLEMGERPQEALKHYRAALKYVPERPRDCLYAAKVLLHKPEFAQSIGSLLRDLLQDQPKSARAYILLGMLHLRQDDLDEAIRAFGAARKIDRDQVWLNAKIAELKNQRKERD